ncbi:MAG: hypothetical protein AAF541_18760 [Pseudomonadota bacterium]
MTKLSPINRYFSLLAGLTIVTSVLVIGAPVTYAQSEDNPDLIEHAEGKEAEGKKEQPDSEKTLKAPGKDRKKRGEDVFNPSEEISEDFAVSFPVDI